MGRTGGHWASGLRPQASGLLRAKRANALQPDHHGFGWAFEDHALSPCRVASLQTHRAPGQVQHDRQPGQQGSIRAAFQGRRGQAQLQGITMQSRTNGVTCVRHHMNQQLRAIGVL